MTAPALLVAGEASGDVYGAALASALKSRYPDRRFVAWGGSRMEAAGCELRHPLADEGVIGLWEAIVRLRRFARIFEGLSRFMAAERPDPVILIDYPGFNARVARRAKDLGLRVVYFIPPKVWVWKAGRARVLAELCDLIVTIFPFEPPLFERFGGHAVWCGHPLVDLMPPPSPRPLPGPPVVAVLPGSRPQEIERLLPRFVGAARILAAKHPEVTFVLPRAHSLAAGLIATHLAGTSLPLTVVDESAASVLDRSTCALATSGTVTLEAALMGVPTVIAYAVNPLSALFFRLVIRAPHVGLPNIVAGRTVCPELLQGDATAEALASSIEPLLDPASEAWRRQHEDLDEVRRRLGERGSLSRIVDSLTPFFEEGAPPCPSP